VTVSVLARETAALKTTANARMVNAGKSAIVNEIKKEKGESDLPLFLLACLEKTPKICYIYFVS